MGDPGLSFYRGLQDEPANVAMLGLERGVDSVVRDGRLVIQTPRVAVDELPRELA